MKQNTESMDVAFDKASLSLNLFKVIERRSWVVLVGEEGVYDYDMGLSNGFGLEF